nr:hypothetical protein GCM10020093_061160 [Planobispora longispora]
MTHVDGAVAPERDIETINTELILADLQTLEKAIPRLQKESRTNKDRKAALDAAEAASKLLDGGTTLYAGAKGAGIDLADLRELHLLTAKPFLYVFNLDADELVDEELRARLGAGGPGRGRLPRRQDRVRAGGALRRGGAGAAAVRGPGGVRPGAARPGGLRDARPADLPDGRSEGDAGLDDPQGRERPEAAGVIHTDFQRGFIKAEVVSFDELVEAGSIAAARQAGKARIEGKDYVMRDGDVVEFRFNV